VKLNKDEQKMTGKAQAN